MIPLLVPEISPCDAFCDTVQLLRTLVERFLHVNSVGTPPLWDCLHLQVQARKLLWTQQSPKHPISENWHQRCCFQWLHQWSSSGHQVSAQYQHLLEVSQLDGQASQPSRQKRRYPPQSLLLAPQEGSSPTVRPICPLIKLISLISSPFIMVIKRDPRLS